MSARFQPRTVDAPGGPITVFESADVERDLDEAIAASGPTPYGRVLWASAPCVTQVLSSLPLAGRRVLELGCGTGLVTLFAARAGAHVLATDVDEGTLEAVRLGAQALDHAAAARVSTAFFDVTSAAPLPRVAGEVADVVVAADLLYEELLAAAAARRVAEARGQGSVVVVGDPGRVFRKRFEGLVADKGHAPSFVHVEVAGHAADVMTLGGP